jgi:hypothetical protein
MGMLVRIEPPEQRSPLMEGEDRRRGERPGCPGGEGSAMTSQHDQLLQDQARLAAGRDLANWATMVHRLHVSEVPDGVDNINVEGRRVVGAIQGFGQLWRKTYRIRLAGAAVTPAEVTAVWKQRFASFWPADSRFHSPLSGLAPGVVVLLDQLLPGHLRLSSGVMILYADQESFTVMSAEGMPFAGWNTFSAYGLDGVAVAQVQVLMRGDDPLFELAMVLFGHKMEDRHWQQTLHNLAAYFGVQAPVSYQTVRLDRRRQWSKASNVWYNAAVRSALHTLAARVRPPHSTSTSVRHN